MNHQTIGVALAALLAASAQAKEPIEFENMKIEADGWTAIAGGDQIEVLRTPKKKELIVGYFVCAHTGAQTLVTKFSTNCDTGRYMITGMHKENEITKEKETVPIMKTPLEPVSSSPLIRYHAEYACKVARKRDHEKKRPEPLGLDWR